MKRIILIIIFTSISAALLSSDFTRYIGSKRIIVSLPQGYRALRPGMDFVFKAVRGNDTFSLKVLKIKNDYEKVFRKEEYILKRYAHRIFKTGNVSVEGFVLNEYILSHIAGDIEVFSRTLMTRSNNALLIFTYTSIEKNHFFRSLYETDIILSKFFRNNIYS
jgi:hypothetical protein